MSARLFLPGHAARRTRARAEADRLLSMSPDLIVVAGFDGYFQRVNPAFVRASEVIRLAGDPSRLEQLTKTRPAIPLRETLAWMYGAP